VSLLPLPPADLAAHPLPVEVILAGTVLLRIHEERHGPLWFGPGAGNPPRNRFDDPAGQYGVCYLGYTRLAAFVETLLRDRPSRVVSEANLAFLALSALTVLHDAPVVQAHSEGLVRLGTTAALSGAKLEIPGGTPSQTYAHAMAWSRALHDHPDAPHGIAYRSSHDDALRCLALFEDRAGAVLAPTGRPELLSDLRDLLADAVDRYKLRLLPVFPAP
jgi:hypothetical protein